VVTEARPNSNSPRHPLRILDLAAQPYPSGSIVVVDDNLLCGKARDGQRVNFSTRSIVRKCKELERQARIEALRDPLSKTVVTISCPLNHNMLWYNSLKSAPLLGTARFLALDRQLTS